MTIALATAETLSEVDFDREPLSEALSNAGIDFEWHAWDEPIDWHRFDLVLIRSTWDYVRRIEAFSDWVHQCGDRLVNPPKLVTWNLHKAYLNQLSRAGVAVVPTQVILKGDIASLTDAVSKMDSPYVIKPAVSAGSFGTYKNAQGTSPPHECFALLAERDLLIQPYLESVDSYGERSLIVVDGEITHAVRKSPRFAQGHESVSDVAVPITRSEADFALNTLSTTQSITGIRAVYARVDLAHDHRGAIVLMELELIEPSLFFRQGPEALSRLVHWLERRLG